MPRNANKIDSIRFTITTSKPVHAHLEKLVSTGLYGRTVPEVAEQMICEKLRSGLHRKTISLLEQPQ